LASSGANSLAHGDDAAAEALTTTDQLRKFFVANAWDLIVRPSCDDLLLLISVFSALLLQLNLHFQVGTVLVLFLASVINSTVHPLRCISFACHIDSHSFHHI
jgi:hypothetical protein